MSLLNQKLRLAVRAWKYRVKLDPAEVSYVRRTIARGNTAIDLGAHKGGYTYWLAESVGRRGTLVSIEPQKQLADRLTQLVASRPQCQVRWAAISDSEGTGRLSVRTKDGPSHGASLTGFAGGETGRVDEVPTISLSGLAEAHKLDRCDFIKCDVEGHEVAVFAAAGEFLKKFRPTVLCECELQHQKGGHEKSGVERLRDCFEPLGYKTLYFKGGSLHPVSEFDAVRDQTYGTGEYCNNFVFEPGAR
ncbi:MAG: FkbM family methyltransferase [Phycisphaerales bacterium]|jgi:FkbM family methyltransferase